MLTADPKSRARSPLDANIPSVTAVTGVAVKRGLAVPKESGHPPPEKRSVDVFRAGDLGNAFEFAFPHQQDG